MKPIRKNWLSGDIFGPYPYRPSKIIPKEPEMNIEGAIDEDEDEEPEMNIEGAIDEDEEIEMNIEELDEDEDSDDRYEISYDGDKNLSIDLTINDDEDVYVEILKANPLENEPKLKKGEAREILCKMIQQLIDEGYTTEQNTISLMSGNISKTHDYEGLNKMYIGMGFKPKKEDMTQSNNFSQTIESFLNWCEEKYS